MGKKNFPELESKRLFLRKITDRDLDYIFKGLSHPEVIRYYGISFKSKEATLEQMRWFKELEEKGSGYWWAICRKDTQEFCGAIGLYEIELKHKKAELGFWLLPSSWGKGFIQESIPVVCEWGFKQAGLHRIEAFVDSKNQNCKRSLEKLHFDHEGTMVDCEFKDGHYISLDIYALFDQ